MLAAAARLAPGRCLGPVAPAPIRRVARRRPARLVQGGDRQLPRPNSQGRPKTGPSPVDRAKPGSKHHVITEGGGIPLAVSLTGGNRNDVTQLMPLIKAIPPVRGRVGRPRQRPDRLYAGARSSSRPPTDGCPGRSTAAWSGAPVSSPSSPGAGLRTALARDGFSPLRFPVGMIRVLVRR
ncbi:hypothetical protein E1286_25385 [Nonomuraea terrae]|uniref:Transposase IS4-like domain-containing protein n=1 Tax=Nonomuraea terrae TaxID=2530383 RepID=A0A4R4YJG5_9ACTN|nr:hypothetical protein E1286_25385 [Nonomuraea terrae]